MGKVGQRLIYVAHPRLPRSDGGLPRALHIRVERQAIHVAQRTKPHQIYKVPVLHSCTCQASAEYQRTRIRLFQYRIDRAQQAQITRCCPRPRVSARMVPLVPDLISIDLALEVRRQRTYVADERANRGGCRGLCAVFIPAITVTQDKEYVDVQRSVYSGPRAAAKIAVIPTTTSLATHTRVSEAYVTRNPSSLSFRVDANRLPWQRARCQKRVRAGASAGRNPPASASVGLHDQRVTRSQGFASPVFDRRA